MSKTKLLASVCAAVAGMSASAALAADIIEPAPAPVIEPIANPWVWTVTPRVWYLWENDFFFQGFDDDPNNVDVLNSNEGVNFPFFGGSISVTPGLGAPTYSLTVLYGKGDAESNRLLSIPAFPPLSLVPIALATTSQIETRRLDIEGIAQIPVSPGFSAILGGRFINFKRDETGIEAFFADFPDFTFQLEDVALTQNIYLGEIGMSVQQPITERFFAFGNLTSMFGYADVSEFVNDPIFNISVFNLTRDELEGGVFGIDTNAGLGARLTDNIALSGRYRLFYLSRPDFELSGGGNFIHGPEVNLSISF